MKATTLIVDFVFSLIVTVALIGIYGLIGFNTSEDTLLILVILLLGSMFGTVIGMSKSLYNRLKDTEEKLAEQNEELKALMLDLKEKKDK